MPIYKYKSLEEAEKHIMKRLQPSDLFEVLSDLQNFVFTLNPPGKIQRGIFKFKSHEQANKHREETVG